jgi:hypothetical protein
LLEFSMRRGACRTHGEARPDKERRLMGIENMVSEI